MAVYGYVRVSTGRQADEGESLDVQQRRIQGHAAAHSLTVAEVFVERGVSGAKPLGERPEGRRLLETLKPGDVVITPKLDRLFRSALDALQVAGSFQKRGISLHLMDLGGDVTNGMGKAFFTIAAAFAEAERDRIRERIRDVKADQRDRGRFLGGTVPFGWRQGPDGALIEDAEQQAAITRMVELRQAGKALRAITADMRAAGHALSHTGVDNIVKAALARRAAA